MLSSHDDSKGNTTLDPVISEKWRGILVNPLRKLSEQLHPSLTAEDSALQYVESLCLKMLAIMCAPPSPLTVQEVEERVSRRFQAPLQELLRSETKDKRKRSMLPQDKLHNMLREILSHKMDSSISVFMTSILESISSDILKLAGNFVKKISEKSGESVITCRDIETAMFADKVLARLLSPEASSELLSKSGCTSTLGYADIVRELVAEIKLMLRDLDLVLRLFVYELTNILGDGQPALCLIFGNINDVHELTVTLLGNLEDAMEMAAEGENPPHVGSCFEELAETEEFRAFVRYANTVTSKESRDALQFIVDDPQLAERVETAGHGFRLAVKYLLPKLLLSVVGHLPLYHEFVLQLMQLAPSPDDRESFKQVECNLHPIKKLLFKALETTPNAEHAIRTASRFRRQLAIEKCNEVSRLIDNWEDKDIGQCCNDFIREDTITKVGPGRRLAERRAYLFDGLLLLCKPISPPVASVVGVSPGSVGTQLKLKERLHVRRLDLADRPDTDEARNCIELSPRGGTGPMVVLSCVSSASKGIWMGDLVMLNTKPMLDKILDSILMDAERRHPLRLPSPSMYRFAEPDSPDNIVFEENKGTSPVPLVKGATLLKLVERLTYHVFADLSLTRTFLTTYRQFCEPKHLLELLVERFRIPDAHLVYADDTISSTDTEKLNKREDWKRYRKEFQQPVKFRVINVIRHWIDQHFYDFERDPELLSQLRTFLEGVDEKPMRKWVNSVLKTISRKSVCEERVQALVFASPPPPILSHPRASLCHPLGLHPQEMARQLTLYEFQLYKQVKPSELVGAVWMKKDKEISSPNLLKIIKHTNNVTRWIQHSILSIDCLEERAATASRVLQMALSLLKLNNFNGVLACTSAFGSAPLHRLKATRRALAPRTQRVLQELEALNNDHLKGYQERLRSINPPCVPFCGIYLTHILHIEEGNPDYLPNSELINFSKRRKVAEITGEIQQYQNQPYCLTVDPHTRSLIENLDPYPDMDDRDITNMLYERSLEIEPRGPPTKQINKPPRKYPDLSLKLIKIRKVNDTGTDDGSQLSPPGWDSASVASLSLHDDRSLSERISLTSPRGGNPTLLDKGLALFDKGKNHRYSSSKDEPPSPREKQSPRHDSRPSKSPVSLCSMRPSLSPQAIVDIAQEEEEPEEVPPLLPRLCFPPSPISPPSLPSPIQQGKPPLPPRGVGYSEVVRSSSPPPLPPRTLLRPDKSAILMRRHQNIAPQLPPKPGTVPVVPKT